MTLAEGPARLSKLSNAHAVLRPTPRTAACLAVVSNPPSIKATRNSESFKANLAFAPRCSLYCRICELTPASVSCADRADPTRPCRWRGARERPGVVPHAPVAMQTPSDQHPWSTRGQRLRIASKLSCGTAFNLVALQSRRDKSRKLEMAGQDKGLLLQRPKIEDLRALSWEHREFGPGYRR